MGSVIYDKSMSLDGYIAGANMSVEAGLGHDGERLHDWALQGPGRHGGLVVQMDPWPTCRGSQIQRRRQRRFRRLASADRGVVDRLFEGEEAVLHVIERIVARLGLRERRGLGFQVETEPLRLHQVVITAKPYASTPSKSTTA